MLFLLKYWRYLAGIAAVLILVGSLILYGYKWGAGSVEAEYDALRAAQRENAASASAGYQEYKKNSDMTNIRKELNNEIATSGGCPVIDGKRLRLYQAAGVRNVTP